MFSLLIEQSFWMVRVQATPVPPACAANCASCDTNGAGACDVCNGGFALNDANLCEAFDSYSYVGAGKCRLRILAGNFSNDPSSVEQCKSECDARNECHSFEYTTTRSSENFGCSIFTDYQAEVVESEHGYECFNRAHPCEINKGSGGPGNIGECCTVDNPCSVGVGDCNTDDQCQGALVCGTHDQGNTYGYQSNAVDVCSQVSCTTTQDCASAGLSAAFVCNSGNCKTCASGHRWVGRRRYEDKDCPSGMQPDESHVQWQARFATEVPDGCCLQAPECTFFTTAGACLEGRCSWIDSACQAPYSVGNWGGNSCPSGYNPIDMESTCRSAATALGLIWKKTEDVPIWPSGCYQAVFDNYHYAGAAYNGVYFNTNSRGALKNINSRLICSKACADVTHEDACSNCEGYAWRDGACNAGELGCCQKSTPTPTIEETNSTMQTVWLVIICTLVIALIIFIVVSSIRCAYVYFRPRNVPVVVATVQETSGQETSGTLAETPVVVATVVGVANDQGETNKQVVFV